MVREFNGNVLSDTIDVVKSQSWSTLKRTKKQNEPHKIIDTFPSLERSTNPKERHQLPGGEPNENVTEFLI